MQLALASLLLAGRAAASPLLGVLEKNQAGAGDASSDSLLASLQGAGAEASSFCSRYLRAEPTAVARSAADEPGTFKMAAHPLSLYGLQPLASTQTPLTYGETPTATSVPGSPACAGLPEGASCSVSGDDAATAVPGYGKVAAAMVTPPPAHVNAAAAAASASCSLPPLPSFVATDAAPADISAACKCLASSSTLPPATAAPAAVATTTTSSACTQITGSYPTTTLPAFCHPSQHVNAPKLAQPTGLALATMAVGAAANKADCCAACAGIYNCVAWHFRPAYTQAASPKLPGGFDPWGRGACDVVYHTGQCATGDGDPSAHNVTMDGALALCPNGRVGGLLDGSNNPSPDGRWANLYYNGWNQGACGAPQDATTSSEDQGVGEKSALCPGQLDD